MIKLEPVDVRSKNTNQHMIFRSFNNKDSRLILRNNNSLEVHIQKLL